MTKFFRFLLFLVVMTLIEPFSPPRPMAAEVSCNDCHSDKASATVSHPAVAMGCDNCHKNVHPKKDPQKKSQLAEQGARLCFLCHDESRYTKGKRVHPPAADGSCLFCHDPHGSNASALLRPDMPILCINCHDKGALLDRFVHGPVMIGDCMACHEPHASKYEKLLKAEVPSLCFRCHRMSKFVGQVVHSPVQYGTCLSCHKPHAAAKSELLSTSDNDLCLQCHPGVSKARHAVSVGTSRGGHMLKGDRDPRRRGRPFGCISCHEPHRSDYQKLFRYPSDEKTSFCSACHKK